MDKNNEIDSFHFFSPLMNSEGNVSVVNRLFDLLYLLLFLFFVCLFICIHMWMASSITILCLLNISSWWSIFFLFNLILSLRVIRREILHLYFVKDDYRCYNELNGTKRSVHFSWTVYKFDFSGGLEKYTRIRLFWFYFVIYLFSSLWKHCFSLKYPLLTGQLLQPVSVEIRWNSISNFTLLKDLLA